jgi:hypothetical protein
MGDVFRINGNAISWGSLALKIATEPFVGFTSISYGDKRARTKLFGMGRAQAARGRTRGKYETDPVKLKGPKATVQELRALLAAQAPDGKSYGDVIFPMVLQYIENEAQITVEFEDCAWTASTSGDEEGGDPMTEEIEIDVMRIRRNGLVLFDETEGQQ